MLGEGRDLEEGAGRDLEEGAGLFSLMAPEPKRSCCETEKRCLPLGGAR